MTSASSARQLTLHGSPVIGKTVLTDTVVTDTFTRTVSNGWGSANTGQAWTTAGGAASEYAVNGSRGTMVYATTNVERRTVLTVGAADQAMLLDALLAVTPTGAPINMGALLRYADVNNYYWIDLQVVETTGLINLRLVKRVATVLTQVANIATGLTNSTTIPQRLRAQISGDFVRARTWRSDGAEPTTWPLAVADTSLTTGNLAGCVSRRTTGNTNVTPTIAFDNLTVSALTVIAPADPTWFRLGTSHLGGPDVTPF